MRRSFGDQDTPPSPPSPTATTTSQDFRFTDEQLSSTALRCELPEDRDRGFQGQPSSSNRHPRHPSSSWAPLLPSSHRTSSFSSSPAVSSSSSAASRGRPYRLEAPSTSSSSSPPVSTGSGDHVPRVCSLCDAILSSDEALELHFQDHALGSIESAASQQTCPGCGGPRSAALQGGLYCSTCSLGDLMAGTNRLPHLDHSRRGGYESHLPARPESPSNSLTPLLSRLNLPRGDDGMPSLAPLSSAPHRGLRRTRGFATGLSRGQLDPYQPQLHAADQEGQQQQQPQGSLSTLPPLSWPMPMRTSGMGALPPISLDGMSSIGLNRSRHIISGGSQYQLPQLSIPSVPSRLSGGSGSGTSTSSLSRSSSSSTSLRLSDSSVSSLPPLPPLAPLPGMSMTSLSSLPPSHARRNLGSLGGGSSSSSSRSSLLSRASSAQLRPPSRQGDMAEREEHDLQR